MMSTLTELALRLQAQADPRRLGQALWMMVGDPVEKASLIWARGLLGFGGEELLWHALQEWGVISPPEFVVRPRELAHFLCSLLPAASHDAAPQPRLVWTLPVEFPTDAPRDSYARAAIELVRSSRRKLVLVAPYLEPKGVGLFHDELLAALHRGVETVVLTHDADDPSSLSSASLGSLRSEGVGLSGALTVFTAATLPAVLLHLKVLVADNSRAIIGSANVTGKGYGKNLEVGVVLGVAAALELEQVVHKVVSSQLATMVFSTAIRQ